MTPDRTDHGQPALRHKGTGLEPATTDCGLAGLTVLVSRGTRESGILRTAEPELAIVPNREL
eukprot:3171708-Alexandrium_andersonii.AAC.1